MAEEQVGDAIRAEEETHFLEHMWEPVESARFKNVALVSVDDQIGVALDLVTPGVYADPIDLVATVFENQDGVVGTPWQPPSGRPPNGPAPTSLGEIIEEHPPITN